MIFEGCPGGAQAEGTGSGEGKVLSVGPPPANPQMANLLFSNSRYQQIPGLADWSIADLPGLVNSDHFHTPRSLVAPTRGAGGFQLA